MGHLKCLELLVRPHKKYEEATRIKSNVYFLDLVDLELTYFG